MTTSPSEPVENDQSGSTDDTSDDSSKDTSKDSGDQGISDDQLPEDLQPGPDNPLASPEGDVTKAPKPGDDDNNAVPEGEQPPGDPSIG
jgi:hypothetical protein